MMDKERLYQVFLRDEVEEQASAFTFGEYSWWFLNYSWRKELAALGSWQGVVTLDILVVSDMGSRILRETT